MSNLRNYIIRETIIFDDESHPNTSPYDIVWPVTVLDAVIDQNTPERVTLRQILDQLTKRLDEGQEELQIEYPVRSVRGERYRDDPLRPEFLGDVVITKDSLALENVDNTADLQKPVSIYQRDWVETYVNQKISEIKPPDLSSLSAHLSNLSNPHRVTFNQINIGGRNGVVTDLIEAMIESHDKASTTHHDIRALINKLQSIVDSNNLNITEHVHDLESELTDHLNRGGQHHAQMFASKEDRMNKVGFFSSPYVNAPGVGVTDLDDTHYPSTLAVANYVEARLVRPVNSSIGGNSGGIGGNSNVRDISVRADDRTLPTPSAANLGQVYLTTELKDSPGWAGLVVCRRSGSQYTWQIEKYIPIAKMDPTYFEEGPNGWKFKPQTSTVDTLTDVELVMNYVSDRTTGESYYALTEILSGSRFVGGTETREIFQFGEMAGRNVVGGTDILPNSLGTSHFVEGSITADKLRLGTIDTDRLGPYIVTEDKLASDCIRYRHLPLSQNYEGDGESQLIENWHLIDRSINSTKLMDYSLGNDKLAIVPGQSVKGRLSLDEGRAEDIPIRTLALIMSEMLGSMVRLPMVGSWPTDLIDYPNGSMVYNSQVNAIGIRVSSTAWRYVSMTGQANIIAT